MDLRTPVKNVLRHCGHAFVSTVHDRLTAIDRMLEDILDQNTEAAATQTALLLSGIHLVENLTQLQDEVGRQVAENAAGRADLQALLQQISKMRDEAAQKSDLQSLAQKLEVAQDILQQNVHIAETQTALLQSGVHLVDRLTHIQSEMQQFETRIVSQVRIHCAARTDVEELAAALADMRADARQFSGEISHLRRVLQSLKERIDSVNGQIENTHATGDAILQSGIDKMLSLGAAMHTTTAQSLAVLEPVAYQTKSFLENQSVRQVCVETSDYLSTNPELGLMDFLYSYLPSRIAFDIGAHVGDVSEHLLNTGYEVYAFEPYGKSYSRLKKRLGAQSAFHSFNLALGSVTGDAPMYLVKDTSADRKFEDPTVFHSLAQHGMPEDLHFAGSVSVPIRRLSDLHREGLVPTDASLVKIDTEGYDLEVIRGMDDYRYPVVLVEFWDTQIPFASEGLLYTVDTVAAEMRQRGYHWYIVIYRVWGQNETAFFCNHDRAIPNSWGNIVFFRDREIFMHAHHWCSATLPRTYFKHVAGPGAVEKAEIATAIKR